MRILVTGGAGFLGSHLCERLISTGHVVTCLDNLVTGSRENVAGFAPRAFELIVQDVIAPFMFDVEQIFHLACPASPTHYQADPVSTIRTCVEGTRHALDCARACGARIMIASTSEVYGDPAVHPQTETYRGNVNPFGVRSCYDEGKRCAEALAHGYLHRHLVDVRVARIFNTYGPRMGRDDGRVISTFAYQALRNESITVRGSGAQTRSFCYVDDMIDGLIRLMNVAGSVPEPVNLGNPVETSISDLAELVRELCGSSSPIVHHEATIDDPSRRCPDITRARQLLAWEPRIELRDGLRRTLEHTRSISARQ